MSGCCQICGSDVYGTDEGGYLCRNCFVVFRKKDLKDIFRKMGKRNALFVGRFQPFHKGHLEVIKMILQEYDEVLIVIGSTQYSRTQDNPYTAEEREEMIKKTMDSEGIVNYRIYKIEDIHDDEKWVDYAVKQLPKFEIVYCGEGLTKALFRKANYKVIELKRINSISSTDIRERIKKGIGWEFLVPKPAEDIMKFIGLKIFA